MKTAKTTLDLRIVADCDALARRALALFINTGRQAVEKRGRFCVAISRYTPAFFFKHLESVTLSKSLPADKIHLFWVDECCGCRHLESNNYKTSEHIIFRQAGIPAENIHRICSGNCNCSFAASIYEQTIYQVVGGGKNGVPQFDLIMLAMDADAHIASLFPDTYAFFDTRDIVRVIYFMDNRHTRITLTNTVLRSALKIAVLVSGAEKAGILQEVLRSEPDEVKYPIHIIWPILDRVTWLINRNAAGFVHGDGILKTIQPRNLQSGQINKRLWQVLESQA